MTREEREGLLHRFESLGVSEDRIFEEVMRARYMDHILFSDPKNSLYGVSQEELYETMKKTSSLFGVYEGGITEYAHVYTLAVQSDPLLFIPDLPTFSSDMNLILAYAVERAKDAEEKVLFAGADSYLKGLTHLYMELGGKRVTVTVKGEDRKKQLAYIFPRLRILTVEEQRKEKERYNYVFSFQKDEKDFDEMYVDAIIENGGKLDLILPYEFLCSSDKRAEQLKELLIQDKLLSAYRYLVCDGQENVLLEIGDSASESVYIGELELRGSQSKISDLFVLNSAEFALANEWSYDVYSYNASAPLQALLSAGILDMDWKIDGGYTLLAKGTLPMRRCRLLPLPEGVEDFGIRTDLANEEVLQEQECVLLQEGDVVLSVTGEDLRIGIVPSEDEPLALCGEAVVLRARTPYTGEYLKLYLDSPVGRLFVETLRRIDGIHLIGKRILRFPMPRGTQNLISEATYRCRHATEMLKRAEEEWRKTKRESVGLLMGKGAK